MIEPLSIFIQLWLSSMSVSQNVLHEVESFEFKSVRLINKGFAYTANPSLITEKFPL